MAVTINADDGSVSGSAGLKQAADSTGVLELQTNGTTAVSVSTGQVVTLTQPLPLASGGTGTVRSAHQALLVVRRSVNRSTATALITDRTGDRTKAFNAITDSWQTMWRSEELLQQCHSTAVTCEYTMHNNYNWQAVYR
jgi:hypothetical protein